MNVDDIIPDSEIERIHGNAYFRNLSKREVVKLGALKCACGFTQSYTSKRILLYHALITSDYKLTDRGKVYLWAAYGNKKF